MNKSTKELKELIAARYPLVQVVSSEEDRVLAALTEIAKPDKLTVMVWSVTKGARVQHSGEGAKAVTRDQGQKPHEALMKIESYDIPGVFVLLDFHPYTKDPQVVRALRDVVSAFRTGEKPRTLVLVSPVQGVPAEVEKEAAIIDFALPVRDEIRSLLTPLATQIGQALTEDVIDACLGLTAAEAENAASKSVVQSNRIDARLVLAEKKQIIKKNGSLEYVETSESMDTVGGLATLKTWLRKRRNAFSAKAREYKLPRPRGVVIIGPTGTGKSLMAKACGNAFAFPLVRLDVGSCMKGLVGGSEEAIRSALKVVEAVAPCVLFIDEIEKGLAGSKSSGMTDGGTMARVFGTILTWLNDTTADVFVVATSNDINALPPELTRKGRFDEIFFADLPNAEERAEIVKIQLRKVGRDPAVFLYRKIADACKDYTGSEIEQIIATAMNDSFDQGVEVTNDHILDAIPFVTPVSRTMADSIKALRDWAVNRAQPANAAQTEEPAPRRAYLAPGSTGN